MRTTVLIGVGAGILWLGVCTSSAPDDRIGASPCDSFVHVCAHKYAYNLGKCPGAPAAPALCDGQAPTNCPAPGVNYYVVDFTYPLSEADNATTTCTDTSSSPYVSYTIYATHNWIDTISPAFCYSTTSCRWDGQKCVPFNQGPNQYDSKKVTKGCAAP
jgi:hypothetical protein